MLVPTHGHLEDVEIDSLDNGPAIVMIIRKGGTKTKIAAMLSEHCSGRLHCAISGKRDIPLATSNYIILLQSPISWALQNMGFSAMTKARH